ncbi:MAG TPA: glutaredoxin family protein [Candidatus Thermoplasmatota archaeon]|nr:glutaredoxin family protein [Candidatus Thermoplasmatota archaeon]
MSPKLPRAERPARAKPKLSERRFKQFALVTTLLGLIVMAAGMNFLITEGAFLLFLILFVAGAALASASVFVEIRPPTPEEEAAAARRGRRGRRSRARLPAPEEAAPLPPARDPITVTLYTRKSCPACREARQILEGWRDQYGIEVWEEDVDASPDLQEQWSDWVPVGIAKGEELFRLSLVPEVVEPRLRDLVKRS